jgi:hypothetical protein
MQLSRRQSLIALLLFSLIGVGLSRAPWLGQDIWNLDEGSTFTMAHQILDGDILYRDAADNRSPLVPYLKAAVFATFGAWNADAVHLGLTLMIGLTVFGLGWIGLQLSGWRLAWCTAISAWFLQIFWIDINDTMSANTEWFVIAFSTAAFALFIASRQRLRVARGFAVGLLFGGAVLCKQPGLLDMLVALVLLGLLALRAERSQQWKLIGFGTAMTLGTLLPLGLFSLHYWTAGAWADYAYYAFTFNTEVYIAEVSLWDRIACVQKPFYMALHNAPLFGLLGIIAAGGLLYRALPQLRRKQPIELLPWLILGWTASGLVSTTLSGREFAHYSEQIIPGLSLAVGWLVQRLTAPETRHHRAIMRVLVIALVVSVVDRLGDIRRELGVIDGNPHALGPLAQQFSEPDERMFVWGYFPEFYFTAQRLPSTRFIYANYLTGLIAWTNLDPLVDSEQGISPGAQEKFEADFTARPPAVIIDTGDTRGYSRFPMENRAWLWPRLVQNYAQVVTSTEIDHRMRLFRQLDDVAALDAKLPAFAEVRSGLEISGYADLRPGSQPMIAVTGAAGIERLYLMTRETPSAALVHPSEAPVQVRFFPPPAAAPAAPVWALGRRADGTWVRSPSFEFNDYKRRHHRRIIEEPSFSLQDQIIRPVALAGEQTAITRYGSEGSLWSVVAPGYLTYAIPAAVTEIRFVHGMAIDSLFESDGYDISVFWVDRTGDETLIWQRRMRPYREGRDQLPQFETITLPPRAAGELSFRFTSGVNGDAEHDHFFFGELEGFMQAPVIYAGGDFMVGKPVAGHALRINADGHWLLHAPARMIWHRPKNLMEFSFDYEVETGAYADAASQTDGVGFTVTLKNRDGSETELWRDVLRPSSDADDRGPQRAKVVLPPTAAEELILSTDDGGHGNTAWDWATVGNFDGKTTGPTIAMPEGPPLQSIANSGYNGGWSDRQSESHWGAQTPQELVYAKPPELSTVKIRFGISPAAARDESGARRSDGVQVRVLFESVEGDIIELFERYLDPFNQSSDVGEQVAEFPTAPGRRGTLHVRMKPGPYDDNSYDWAYWGQFEGKTTAEYGP